MVDKLATDAREAALDTLQQWTHEPARDAITRDIRFKDFTEAFAFMASVALVAERMDHHPEWSNVYNRVSILLTTHDANGLTQNDIDLATHIDDIAAKLGGA